MPRSRSGRRRGRPHPPIATASAPRARPQTDHAPSQAIGTPSRGLALAWVTGAAIVALVGALYVRTAARDIVFGDTPELVGDAFSLGVAHPPGYPVWTVLGHVFTLLPIGTIPFRVSLFSVLAGTVAAVFVYLTARRLTMSLSASAAAAIVFALVPVVWAWSIVPEVFALADAIAAAFVLLLLVWHQGGNDRWFIGAAFVGGLGVAHHQTIALLAPAVLYLMWRHRRRIGAGLLARAAVAAFVGLLPYAYLPIAAAQHPVWNWSEISSLSDLADHVLRSGYGTGTLVSEQRFQGGEIFGRLRELALSLTLPEAILVAIGLLALYRIDRAWMWFTLIAALVAGPAFIAYSNVNVGLGFLGAVLERFFLLMHVVLAPVVAVGIVATARSIGRALRVDRQRLLETAIALAAVSASVGVAVAQFARVDQSEDHWARTFGEDLLSSMRPNAFLLAGGDAVIGPVEYLRSVEGARPDVVVIQMPLLRGEWYVRQLRRLAPQLVVRFAYLDGAAGTLRNLVETNGVDRFDVAGGLVDESLSGVYGLYRRGLVSELHPTRAPVDLDAYAAENERALAGYRIPRVGEVSDRPWDDLIRTDYALVAYDVGGSFDRAKRVADARHWYERALTIDPGLAEARSALAALPPP